MSNPVSSNFVLRQTRVAQSPVEFSQLEFSSLFQVPEQSSPSLTERISLLVSKPQFSLNGHKIAFNRLSKCVENTELPFQDLLLLQNQFEWVPQIRKK